MKTLQDAVTKAAHDAGLGPWPLRRDEKPCGCYWERKPHGWGGYYYGLVYCGGCLTPVSI